MEQLERLAAAAYRAEYNARGVIPDRQYHDLPEDQKRIFQDVAFAVILQCAAECDVEVEKVQ